MPSLKWSDADEIGFELNRKFPDLDPLTVRFGDLRGRVLELEIFEDSTESNEKLLEAIQMAWLECYRDG